MSYKGVALSATVSSSLNFLIPYIWISLDQSIVKEGCWTYITKDSFKGLWEYLKYAIPCYFMIALEIWGFEMLSIFSGYLGVKELGASIILININVFLFMIPLGISFIASSMVGNNLGGNKPKTAKIYSDTSLLLVFSLSFVVGCIMLIFKSKIGYIFTNDEEVCSLIAYAMPAVIVLFVGDFMQGISGGILRGMGLQKYGTPTCIIGYWIIAIPLSYFFGFYLGFGLRGIWFGMPLGVMTIATVFIYVICSTNFKELSGEIMERIEKEKNDLEEKNSDDIISI